MCVPVSSFPVGEQLQQHRAEFAAKLDHQHFARQQAILLRHDPLARLIEPTAGDEHMQVHIGRQRLTPRMQSRQQTRPSSQELRIVKQLQQRL